MYDKHENEVVKEKKQATEKVKYFEVKADQLAKLLEAEREDLRDK